MKILIVCVLALFTVSVLADSRKGNHVKDERHDQPGRKDPWERVKHRPSSFDVVPLNSPVKEPVAKFLLKTPKNFEIAQVFYKVKGTRKVMIKDKDFAPLNLVNGPKGKELHIPSAGLINGFYRLYVRVRSEEKAKPKNRYVDHDYKNTYHDFVKFVVDKKSTAVPMPDPVKNNATVGGIDSDNDGIRDDVQIWIDQNYSSNSTVLQAVRQKARAMQDDLLKVNDKEASITASRKRLDSNGCLSAVIGLENYRKVSRELKKYMMNTKERLYAETKADSNFSGQIYSMPNNDEESLALCDF